MDITVAEEFYKLLEAAQQNEAELCELNIIGITVEESLTRFEFRGCVFKGCTFCGSLENTYFTDTDFFNCNLSNIPLNDASMTNIRFENCRMTGAAFINSRLYSVEFKNSKMDFVNFGNAYIRGTLACDCKLDHCMLEHTDHKNLCFKNCDLTYAQVFKTPLKGLDLSDNEISGIIVDEPSLRGVLVNREQAAELAKLFGIKVKD